MVQVFELQYDISKTERGYYYDQELLAEYFGKPVNQVDYVGTGRAGHVYQINGKNYVVISDFDTYNCETKQGVIKFRRYAGPEWNLKKHQVILLNIAAGGLK